MVAPMLVLRAVCLLALCLAGATAMAQSGQQPESAASLASPIQEPATGPDKRASANQAATRKQEVKTRVAEWLATCLKDWDQATHMTTKEWRATCERVASERGKFLIDNPTVGSMFLDARGGRQR
jgi:hypothetical protein